MDTSITELESAGRELDDDAAMARSFVSRFLAGRLEAGGALSDPEEHQVSGALLLTDIEGFTAHVERRAEEGAKGLELLATEVNTYFVAVAEAVGAYGGDVISIAGDSFLCLWPATSAEGLREAARHAGQAALVLQEKLTAASDRSLPTRVGISAGSLDLRLLGGLNGRWEVVSSGAAFDGAARAERRGRARTVTVDEGVRRLLEGKGDFGPAAEDLTELRELRPSPRPVGADSPRPDVELLRPFVPAPVRSSASVAPEWLAEFRPVTVVMAHRRDGGGGVNELHSLVRSFQELMARYDGASKVIVDNRGLTFSGVFGLPPRAHSDDRERGLRSAMAVQQALGDGCTVGVGAGRVFCGVFGSDSRREYTLFGDVVNLASRLSGSGAGEVLLDPDLAAGSALELDLHPIPDLVIRGRRRPVAVHALRDLRSPKPSGRAMIDRDDERAQLLAHMGEVLESGRSVSVLLSGESGIGKSSLARDTLHRCSEAGLRCLELTADAVDRGTAYGPWRPVVAELLRSASTPEELAAHLDGATEDLVRLLPLLSAVLAGAPPENATTRGMSGDARRDQVNALVARALAHASRSCPVALLVEDAQWLDSASWSLLMRVASEVPRIFLLITERRGAGGGPSAPVRSELLALGAREMVIRSLSAEHTTTLIRLRLGVPSVPQTVLEPILERVAGHPLFCESLLQAMVSSGAIRVGVDEAELVPGRRVDIPSSIESAVLSRLDSLQAGHEITLKTASVVGRAFTAEEVIAVHPGATKQEVGQHLAALCELELIDAGEEPGRFTFRHQIVHDIAYQLLTPTQRRPLHRRLAEHYEATHAEQDSRSSAALLAHHFRQAEEPDRALPYLERAGEAALREGAFQEAVQLLEQAIERVGANNDPRRAILEKHLADAHYFVGNMVGARALLELCLERLGHPMPESRTAAARVLAGESLRQARRLVRKTSAESSAVSQEGLATAVEALRVLVQISYLHGSSTLELCGMVMSALNLGERLGPSPELARALADAAGMTDVLGLRGLASRYGQRAVRMAAREEHSHAAAYVWNILAIMHAGRGEWATALQSNGRALELFGELGDYNLEAELWQTRAAIQLCRGDLAEAERAYVRTHELAQRTGSAVNMCWSLLDEAQTRLARGEVETALAALDRALAIPTPGSDGGTVIERRATTAWARCRQGRYAEAVADAEAVLQMAGSSLPTGWVWAEMTAQAVEVLIDVRAVPDSGVPRGGLDRRIGRGLRILSRLAFTFGGVRARTSVLRARAALQHGDVRSAERFLKRAERHIQREDQALDAARLALARAEMSPPGEGRRALLATAKASLTALGQSAELARAERLE